MAIQIEEGGGEGAHKCKHFPTTVHTEPQYILGFSNLFVFTASPLHPTLLFSNPAQIDYLSAPVFPFIYYPPPTPLSSTESVNISPHKRDIEPYPPEP